MSTKCRFTLASCVAFYSPTELPETTDILTLEWAVQALERYRGTEYAANAWRRCNGRRRSLGRHTSIPAYGTALFAAYFAKKSA